MKVINRSILSEFWQSHPQEMDLLKAWLLDVSQEKWNGPSDVLLNFPKAKFFDNDGICFEITSSFLPLEREVSAKKPPYYLLTSVKYSAHLLAIRGVDLSPPAFVSTPIPFLKDYHASSPHSK